jgi:hypothetical protein
MEMTGYTPEMPACARTKVSMMLSASGGRPTKPVDMDADMLKRMLNAGGLREPGAGGFAYVFVLTDMTGGVQNTVILVRRYIMNWKCFLYFLLSAHGAFFGHTSLCL